MMSQNGVYVIAEAGVNHNGQRDLAFELVDVAARAGADAVKFQTFDARKLAARSAPKANYQKRSTAEDESQLDMLRKLELPRSWHSELRHHAKQVGIEFLSTAFDLDSLDFLDEMGLPMFKVPSGELTNAPLLWAFASKRKPLVLSTGMATLSEVEQALAVVAHAFSHDNEPQNLNQVWMTWGSPQARSLLQGKVTLLHCTSQYPSPIQEVNLRAMDTLRSAFGLPIGYSDHTAGTLIPVAAVARGAKLIEKHFTVSRELEGPDHAASLEPDELARMVREVRDVEVALGDGIKAPQPSEWDTRQVARQQIIAARPIRAGQTLTREDITTARCGSGIEAGRFWDMVGTSAVRDLEAGEAL